MFLYVCEFVSCAIFDAKPTMPWSATINVVQEGDYGIIHILCMYIYSITFARVVRMRYMLVRGLRRKWPSEASSILGS